MEMPYQTQPMTALLISTGLNAILLPTITPVYDFACFHLYWEQQNFLNFRIMNSLHILTVAMAFDAEYARWLEEHNRNINELRTAVNSHASDLNLRVIVDKIVTHFNDLFRLKCTTAKADVFHILSGMWKTPLERCFMWIGGFRPSELLKLLVNHLEPLTEQVLTGIFNLKQSSHEAEDALSQGLKALQQSLAETLTKGCSGPEGSSGNMANYIGQMAMAMGKLGTLEGFLYQADNLRQQTLQQMHHILTTRHSAPALLTINGYFLRLGELSSLWLSSPRE